MAKFQQMRQALPVSLTPKEPLLMTDSRTSLKIINVLLIENDLGDIQIIQDFLSEGREKIFNLSVSTTMKDAIQKLIAGGYDVVVFDPAVFPDYSMEPKIIQTFKDCFSIIPVIVLTAFESDSANLLTLEFAVRSFLYKHKLNKEILVASIRNAIEHQHLLNELQMKNIELETSEARFRTMIEKNADGMVIIGRDMRILYINSSALNLIGGKFASIDGRVFPYSFTLHDPSEIMIEHGQKKIFVEMRVAEIPWKGENCYLAALRDITARKIMDEQLKDTMEELGRSNKDLEQFAYAVSHDLNEPLRSMTGYIQLLSRNFKGQFDEKADHYIERCITAAGRMQNMITNVLEYSRLSTKVKDFSNIDCNEVLSHVMANLESSIRDTNARITSDNLPVVAGDFLQMLRVFQNLISNAIKFRGDKPPEIHVGVAEDGGFYRFSIADKGIGIDSKYFERIFVIFQRLHSRNDCPGYGVGLAMCKRIVERHGGRIWVLSTPGQGSTFYFTIPHRKGEGDNGK